MVRTRYMRGHLAAVDEALDSLERDAAAAGLGFGIVRVSLCRTTNALARGHLDRVPALIAFSRSEGARLHTFAAHPATLSQQLILMLELGEFAEIVAMAKPAADRGPSVWHAVLARCGERDAAALHAVTDEVPTADDTFPLFVALAAEVAARDGHAELGAWCADRLDEMGDLTVTIGLGTIVMGFAAHFAGFAHAATGNVDEAVARFDRARTLALDSGADLWAAHSSIELAALLAPSLDEAVMAHVDGLAVEAALMVAVSGSDRLARRYDSVREG